MKNKKPILITVCDFLCLIIGNFAVKLFFSLNSLYGQYTSELKNIIIFLLHTFMIVILNKNYIIILDSICFLTHHQYFQFEKNSNVNFILYFIFYIYRNCQILTSKISMKNCST